MKNVIFAGVVVGLTIALPAVGAPKANSKVTQSVTSHEFCDSLLDLLLRFFPDSVQKTRIAVFPFVNSTGDKGAAGGTWVSEYLVSKLRKTSRFVVVDRNDYRRTLRNNDIEPREVIDDSAALRVSKELGAPYALAGAILNSPTGNFKVDGKIYDTQTGVIITGAGIEATVEELEAIESEMVANRARTVKTPAVLRSMALPGWGQFYRKRPVMGVVYGVGMLGALGGVGYFLAEDLKAKDQWLAVVEDSAGYANDPAERDRREFIVRGKYEDMQRSCGYAALVATGVWAVNILDVIAAGLQAENEYRLYFSSKGPEEAEVGLAILF